MDYRGSVAISMGKGGLLALQIGRCRLGFSQRSLCPSVAARGGNGLL